MYTQFLAMHHGKARVRVGLGIFRKSVTFVLQKWNGEPSTHRMPTMLNKNRSVRHALRVIVRTTDWSTCREGKERKEKNPKWRRGRNTRAGEEGESFTPHKSRNRIEIGRAKV